MDPQLTFAHSAAVRHAPDASDVSAHLENLNMVGDNHHHHHSTLVGSFGEGATGLENLYPALVQCFGIILLGYLAGKFNFINDVEAKGLGTFVGTFSLPALIFISLCQLDFSSVNWLFLLAITLAKTAVFFSVLIIGLVVGHDISQAALFAIFCTQSNDFGLGYPVLKAIYDENHPDYPIYLYLLAPVSLVFLNPIGFIFMEVGRSQRESLLEDEENRENPGDGSRSQVNNSPCKIARRVVTGICSNPLVFMTVAGILGNLAFHHIMPKVIHDITATLGSAFTASALFLLGLRMVRSGKKTSQVNSRALILPFILISIKCLVLPLVAREIVNQLNPGKTTNETLDLSDYGFLYGTIPTAPSVFVYAVNYGVVPEMIANLITVSTFVSAPIMFISAKLLTIRDLNPNDYIEEIDVFLFDISIIGVIAALWVIFVLMITKKAFNFPHRLTLLLVICQGTACVGAIFWSFLDCRHGWKLYLQFAIYGYGVLGSRICTALIAISLVMLQIQRPDGTTMLRRFRRLFMLIGVGTPVILVAILSLVVAIETPEHGRKEDPNFQYGETQAIAALVIIIICFLTTIVSMIIRQRIGSSNTLTFRRSREGRETDRLLSSETDSSGRTTPSGANLSNNPAQEECCTYSTVRPNGEQGVMSSDIEDIPPLPVIPGCPGGRRRYRCDSTHREYCSNLIRRYEVPPAEDAMSPENVLQVNSIANVFSYVDDQDPEDIFRHNFLLVILSISMFVGGCLCTWTLLMEGMGGIYLELVFLDGLLNLGQPLITLAFFGINTKGIYLNLRLKLRKLIYRRDKIVLPAWEDLDVDDRTVSTMFIKHHVAACMEEITHDINKGLRTHLASFTGEELVTWLVDHGLAQSRQEAESMGRNLLRGRVIRHVDDHIDFYDDTFIYTFLPENRRLRN